MSKSTTVWRIDKKLADELNKKFPDVRKSDLIKIMYNTSLLKLESRLRKNLK